jgi:hypothetical protein
MTGTEEAGVQYTLQVAEVIETEVASEEGTEPQEPTYMERTAWFDVWSGTVPARTKARTVIRKAVAQLGLEPSDNEPLRVRLLSPEVAEPIEVYPPVRAPGPRQVRL